MGKEKEAQIIKQNLKCVLVSIIRNKYQEARVEEYLDELEFLAETAGIDCVGRITQRLESPNKRTYVGEGKLAEIKAFAEDNNINAVIFDDELSPSQIRNLEKELETEVVDRTNLILDIFSQRATTAYAKTQVQLARFQYLLPRLTGMWTHLERQRGGTGTRGGAGEKEIETDRRIVRDKITRLKAELTKIDKQMSTQRGNRKSMIRVALVGYTNVGKSTLMNQVSKSDVFAENKLFATLDTTVRKVVINNIPFLLTDTVGFIRKLPTQLVESFKSTLDEVREADLLIHIVDISHPDFEDQFNVVNKTLEEIGAGDKPVFVIFNKIDNYSFIEKDKFDLTPKTKENISLEELQDIWKEKLTENKTPSLFISAKEKINIDKFREDLYNMIHELHSGRFPFNNFLY